MSTLMMMTPATMDRVSRSRVMKLPRKDALAPIATKTVAKPATKAIADMTTLRQAAAGMFSSLSSLIDVPAKKHR